MPSSLAEGRGRKTPAFVCHFDTGGRQGTLLGRLGRESRHVAPERAARVVLIRAAGQPCDGRKGPRNRQRFGLSDPGCRCRRKAARYGPVGRINSIARSPSTGTVLRDGPDPRAAACSAREPDSGTAPIREAPLAATASRRLQREATASRARPDCRNRGPHMAATTNLRPRARRRGARQPRFVLGVDFPPG